MDISTVTAIGGLVVATASVSVAVFALDPTRRSEFLRFWKKWLTVGFIVIIATNSIVGIYLFMPSAASTCAGGYFQAGPSSV